MDIDLIANILFATIRTGTPLLIVALGELVCEKSGVLNLGQEGMMLMGAVAGFIVALHTGNNWVGMGAAMSAGVLMSLLFGFIAMQLNANQVATGLALTIFGTGLSGFIGLNYVGKSLQGFTELHIPVLSNIPGAGRIFVLPRHIRLHLDCSLRGCLLLLQEIPGGAYRQSRWGIARVGSGHWPASSQSSLFGGNVWGRDGRSGWWLSITGLHTALGGQHDSRSRLDRPGPGRFRQLAG